MSDEEVVVVTGGSGFLGQHIVKHLLEQNQFPIREVRVFDLQPLEWVYGLNANDTAIPLHQYQGDICNPADLQEAIAGATVVIHNASIVDVSANPHMDKIQRVNVNGKCLIHNASIVDVSANPDMDKIQRVNVNGTENVIKSCIKNNVEKLVYTSSVTAVDNLKTLGAYSMTKRRAEDLILGANGQILSNGNMLQSCALRPVGIYGKGTPAMVDFLKQIVWGKTMIRLGGNASVIPMAYAGNIAGAYVAAIHRLRNTSNDDESELCSPAGRAISLADDTPLVSTSRFMEPYALKFFGAKPSMLFVPLWFMLFAAHVFEWVSYLMKPFIRINFPLSRLGVVSQYGLPIPRAEEIIKYLGYKPLYSYETAFAKCVEYYEDYICKNKK